MRDRAESKFRFLEIMIRASTPGEIVPHREF
jgi:hypothetical protein